MWQQHHCWFDLFRDEEAFKAYLDDRNKAICWDLSKWDWTEVDKIIIPTLETGYEATAILQPCENEKLCVKHVVIGDNPKKAPKVHVPGLIHLHTHPGDCSGEPSELDLVNALDRNNKSTWAWSVVYSKHGRWIYRSSGVDFSKDPMTREHYQRRVKKLEEDIARFDSLPGYKPHTDLITILQRNNYQVQFVPFVPNGVLMVEHSEPNTPNLWCDEEMMDVFVTEH